MPSKPGRLSVPRVLDEFAVLQIEGYLCNGKICTHLPQSFGGWFGSNRYLVEAQRHKQKLASALQAHDIAMSQCLPYIRLEWYNGEYPTQGVCMLAMVWPSQSARMVGLYSLDKDTWALLTRKTWALPKSWAWVQLTLSIRLGICGQPNKLVCTW